MVWEQIFTEESGDQMNSKKASKLGNISYTCSIHYTVYSMYIINLLCSMYIKKNISDLHLQYENGGEDSGLGGGGGGFQWYKIKFLKFSALFPGTLHFKSKFYLGTFFFPQFENT